MGQTRKGGSYRAPNFSKYKPVIPPQQPRDPSQRYPPGAWNSTPHPPIIRPANPRIPRPRKHSKRRSKSRSRSRSRR